MKTSRKQSGIILLYVILLLALVGPTTWILTHTALQSARQTRQVKVELQCENLIHNALAWAAQNRSTLAEASEGTVFRPDLSSLRIPRAVCTLTVVSGKDARTRIEIEAQTAVGRLSRTEKRLLTLSPLNAALSEE